MSAKTLINTTYIVVLIILPDWCHGLDGNGNQAAPARGAHRIK